MVLKRSLNTMPEDIADLLATKGLATAYAARPAYLGWIARATRPETRPKRITQMCDELASGDAYMKMRYNGPTI